MVFVVCIAPLAFTTHNTSLQSHFHLSGNMASPLRLSPHPINLHVPPRPPVAVNFHRNTAPQDHVELDQHDELMDQDNHSEQQDVLVDTASGQGTPQQPNERMAAVPPAPSGPKGLPIVASAADTEATSSASTSLQPTSAAAVGSGDGLAPRKRKRLTRACDSCRRRKIKCDGLSGCGPCRAQAVECTYNDVMRKRGPRNGRKSGGSMANESGGDAAAPLPASQPASVTSATSGPTQDHAILPLPLTQRLHGDAQGPSSAAYPNPHRQQPPVAQPYPALGHSTYQNRQERHNVITHQTEYQTPPAPAYLPNDPHQLVHRYGHAVPIPFALAASGASRAQGRDYERQDARTHHDPRLHSQGHFAPAHPHFGPSPTTGRFRPGALAHDAHHHQLYHDSPKYHGLPTHHPEAYCNGGDVMCTSPSRPLHPPPKTNPFGGSEYPSGLDRQPSFGSPQRSYRLDHVRLAIHHYATSDLSALDPPSLRSWALSRPLDSVAQSLPRRASETLGLAIASFICRSEGQHFYAGADCAPPTLPEVSEWIALAAGTALTDMTACPETVLTLLLLTRAELLVGNIVSAWRLVGGAWTSVQLLRDFAAVNQGFGSEALQRARKRSASGSPLEHQILDSDPLGKFPVDELVLAAVSMHLLVATILGTSPSLDLPTLACGAPMSPHDPIRASERDLTLAIASAVQFANSPNSQATVRSLVADIERCITACPEPLVFPPAAPNLLVASTASHVQAHATLIMLTRPAILRTLNLLPSSSSQPAARSPHGDVPAPRSPGEFEILFGAMSRSTGALVRVAQWISVQSDVHDTRLRHAITLLTPMLANAMHQAATGVAMIVASSAQKQQALGRQSHDLPHHQSAAKSLLAALEVVSAASSAHASGSPSIVDRYLGTVIELSTRLATIPAGSPLPTEFLFPLNQSDAIRVTNSSMGLPIPSPYRTPIAVPHTSNMRQPLAPNSDAARMHMDRSDWRMHGPAPGRLSETALAAGHLRPPPLPNSNSPSYSSSSAPRLSQPLTQSPPESLRPMLPPISSFLPKPDQISTAVNPNNGSAIRDTSSLSRSPPAAAPVGHASNGGVSHNGRQAESPGLAMLRMAAAAATMSDSGFDVRSLAATGDGAGGESRV